MNVDDTNILEEYHDNLERVDRRYYLVLMILLIAKSEDEILTSFSTYELPYLFSLQFEHRKA